ncbi:MAG: ABC transporter ATP-binding protein, partial [Gemmatimonadetes bacterium]|nr:ABC transporter ATP-binding protein [Gemmatimonadota bacterium]
MITTQHLKKLYTTEEVETSALNDVTMAVDQGEFVAV